MSSFALVGTMVDSRDDWSLRLEEKCLLVVNYRGIICHRARLEGEGTRQIEEAKEKFSLAEEDITYLNSGEFLLPGFIDSHVHAPQFPNAGLGLDLPLLEWLQRYTYPMESRFQDLNFASEVYTRVVDLTLDQGITSAAYFGSIHREACELLCQLADEKGQRALVGKVCMNRNGFQNYIETTSDSLNETRLFLASGPGQNGHQNGDQNGRRYRLAEPVICPRFIATCDPGLRRGLADLANEFDARIHSHIAETKRECAWVRELEPNSRNYTDAYDRSGLLTDKTIMAHGIYLDDPELQMMRERGTGVSHCPNSNCSIRSGSLDVQRMKASGVKVGLGTDCSAGFTTSMMDAMRSCISTSNHLSIANPTYKPLNYADALYLGTLGSAVVTHQSDRVGSFCVGKQFDALRVDMSLAKASHLFGHESPDDMLHKFVFLGDDRNIRNVWTAGRKVKGE